LVRRGWRGSSFLFENLSRLGLFDYVVRFRLTDALFIDVPLYTDNLWDETSLLSYEAVFITSLLREAETLPRPLRFIDCGASFGLFSMRMASACHLLESIVAFEPDPEMFKILATNFRRIGLPAEARNNAVSNWRGLGELRAPK
jgi:hypothetical protein